MENLGMRRVEDLLRTQTRVHTFALSFSLATTAYFPEMT